MLRIYLEYLKDVLFWDMLWHMLKTLRDMLKIYLKYAQDTLEICCVWICFGICWSCSTISFKYTSNMLTRYAQISVGYAVLMEPGEE